MSWGSRAGEAVETYISTILVIVGYVLIAVFGVLLTISMWWVVGVIAGAVAILIGQVLNVRNRRSLSSVTKERDNLRDQNEFLLESVENILSGYLLTLGRNKLKFEEQNGNACRISLYRYDDGTDQFIQIGRFSDNPSYDNPSPQLYGVTGVIGAGWEHKIDFMDSMPDPIAQWDDYVSAQSATGLSLDETTDLTMKSRLYYARRIDSPDGVNRFGVLVIESEDPNYWAQVWLDRIVLREEEYLAKVFEVFHNVLPQPSVAARLNF